VSDNWNSSYWELTRSKSDCVLFIRDDQSDVLIPELQEKLSAAGIRKAYFDCRLDWIAQHIAGSIGQQLQLDHAPYASWAPPTPNKISVWVPFLDDMVGIAPGMAELDRVTGGGFVPGSVLLVGGDPGIGKSTLLTQATACWRAAATARLYLGRRGVAQVRLRAERLGLADAPVQLGRRNLGRGHRLDARKARCRA
jgi:hypothetical protein